MGELEGCVHFKIGTLRVHGRPGIVEKSWKVNFCNAGLEKAWNSRKCKISLGRPGNIITIRPRCTV